MDTSGVKRDGSDDPLDRDDLRKLIKGDPVAWKDFALKYEPMIYGYFASRTSSQHDAQDLVQEVFMALCNSFSTYDPKSAFKPWLMAIAGNKLTDLRRYDGAQMRPPRAIGEVTTNVRIDQNSRSPLQILEERELHERFRRLQARHQADEAKAIVLIANLRYRAILLLDRKHCIRPPNECYMGLLDARSTGAIITLRSRANKKMRGFLREIREREVEAIRQFPQQRMRVLLWIDRRRSGPPSDKVLARLLRLNGVSEVQTLRHNANQLLEEKLESHE